MNRNFLLLVLLVSFSLEAKPISLQDNVLFGFEKCKTLTVDLEKGQLKEAISSPFDLHCRKQPDDLLFKCTYFDSGSDKKLNEVDFTGGSHLGEAEMKDNSGRTIKFLIGKKFASYQSAPDNKVCAGIFIFEQDALKQRASSLKSDLQNQ